MQNTTNSYKTTDVVISAIRDFLKLESASGILLIGAMALAMIMNNTALDDIYQAIIKTPIAVQIGALAIDKPLLLWINDGLMALFFFTVGLELKREILEGELSRLSQVALPLAGAIGGMLVPALIYAFLNRQDSVLLHGWAIPAATDIAFALGILMLLGKRVPNSLKIFLITLAVFDDVGAIIVIALFYTADLSYVSLIVAAICIVILVLMNLLNVTRIPAYALVGLVLWVSVLKSGVHATLATVIMAFTIPLRTKNPEQRSPLHQLESDLHPMVAYFVLPVFAFANAGVNLGNLSIDSLTHPVPVGIALGLFLGKQLGVFGFAWLAIKLGIASKSKDISWSSLYGVAILCGVGFTMSLFIGALAFNAGDLPAHIDERFGILLGSVLSAVVGYLWLRYSLKRDQRRQGGE
ncbi:MAG: Na+/H+ antiporter NhaA [Gammaproteobacteria bacterium]|nr:Na+/H+ antiporter NhaA [Gammaproteobacteria bacterium]